jgi:3-methyladenine DNA glycosylase AlkD
MFSPEISQKDIFLELEKFGDSATKIALESDRPTSSLNYIGVRLPKIKSIVKELTASLKGQDDEAVLAELCKLWESSRHFEELSVCLEYLHKNKKFILNNWGKFTKWANKIDNWDHSDSLSRVYSYALENSNEKVGVYQFLKVLNQSDSEWLRRISVVSLKRYSGSNAIFLPYEQMIQLIEPLLDDKRVYVQLGVGWVLRDMRKVYCELTDEFVKSSLDRIGSKALSRFLEKHTKEEKKLFKLSSRD